jgi:hypothetical protein
MGRRQDGPKRLTIGSRAVAVAIVEDALRVASAGVGLDLTGGRVAYELADEVVRLAWDVEYKPNAERLVLVLDASLEHDEPEEETPAPLRPIADNPQA